MLVLSCTTRCFPALPLEDALARIAWAGFGAAELFLPADAALPEADALAAALAASGLAPAAVDTGGLAGEDLTSGLEAAAHVGRCAVLAHQIQANRVVCDLAIASEALAEEILGHLLEALAPVPVLLCLRNRPEDSPEAMEQLVRLVAADADRLGLSLDPGAAYRAGWDPLREWEQLAPLIRHVYATDAIGRMAASLGAGEVPWEELAARLREGGYSGAVTLWQEPGVTSGDSLFAEAELKEARFLLESWFIGAD